MCCLPVDLLRVEPIDREVKSTMHAVRSTSRLGNLVWHIKRYTLDEDGVKDDGEP